MCTTLVQVVAAPLECTEGRLDVAEYSNVVVTVCEAFLF